MGLLDFVKEGSEKNLSSEITKLMSEKGISIQDLKLNVEGSVVTVSGVAGNTDIKSKAVQLIKGIGGVSQVKDMLQIKGAETVISEEGTRTYKVKYGDTLWGISEKFYGDGSKYMKIFEANKEVWKSHNYDPNVLYPDWELKIP